MSQRWVKLNALNGGTEAMRKMGTKYLPQEEAEEKYDYNVKLERSFLYNGYANTLRRIVSMPFARPVILKNPETLSERLQAIEDDADKAGRNLTQFLRNVMHAGLNFGLTHILVDFDAVSPDLTRGEEMELGTRPRFVHVLPTQLISWFPDHPPLQEVRIREFVKQRRGQWGEEVVEQIRVIRQDTWQLFRKVNDKQGERFVPFTDEQPHTAGKVPLVTYYTNATGFLTADPPYEDLAWLNVAHWQSLADQRNILRYARVPILLGTGIDDEDTEAGLDIKISRMTTTKNEAADIKWVEHSGQAIEAGRRDLLDLEEKMTRLGDQPMDTRSGDVTATGRAIDEGRVHTDAHAAVRALENTANQAYNMAGGWIGEQVHEDFSVDINSEFNLLSRSSQDMAHLDRARERKDIHSTTWMKEAKKRGILSEDVDPDDEFERMEDEKPSLPFFGPSPGGDDDDDDDDKNDADQGDDEGDGEGTQSPLSGGNFGAG
jgi:hypothetical protein